MNIKLSLLENTIRFSSDVKETNNDIIQEAHHAVSMIYDRIFGKVWTQLNYVAFSNVKVNIYSKYIGPYPCKVPKMLHKQVLKELLK